MTYDNVRKYKERLLALRARLCGDVKASRAAHPSQGDEEFARMPIHIAELANETFEREVAVRLLGTKQETLDQVEKALEAIEDGAYGVCDECRQRIPKTRLDVLPYATLCVRCARRAEKTETASTWR